MADDQATQQDLFRTVGKPPAERACTKCGVVLPFDAKHFVRVKRAKFGLRPRCRKCATAKGREDTKRCVDRKKAAGICTRCSQPAIAGRKMCESHVAGLKRERRVRRAIGLCTFCDRPTVPSSRFCELHVTKSASGAAKRIADGKCRRCKEYAAPGRRHCVPCLKKARKEQVRKRAVLNASECCVLCGTTSGTFTHCEACREAGRVARLTLKIETLNAYGGCFCLCCGENRLPFLTLEHVNQDGNSHRKDLGGRGFQFYRKLKRMGYPNNPPMVVNCFNCNIAKGANNGVCPHDLERQAAQKAE